MNNALLVRFYRVEFGDCIYVQIPDDDEIFSILIDCGSSSVADTVLKPVVKHIISNLPRCENGKPRLDLLVATHPHADHIKGFDPTWFEDVTVGRIWMTAFMNPLHDQAKRARAFGNVTEYLASDLLDRPGLHLSNGVQMLLRLSLRNADALSALRKELLAIHPRLYVARDIADRLRDPEREAHQLHSENGITTFRGFKEAGTCLRVLAPEWDIDGTYLGRLTAGGNAFLNKLMLRLETNPDDNDCAITPAWDLENKGISRKALPKPTNISDRDFRLLCSGLLHSALAFSQTDQQLKNNTSVVLLLEWHGKRLLFTGDAEWDGEGVEPHRHNCAWDVMLKNPDVNQVLLQPLDLFKVSHHGSINGTPFNNRGAMKILNKLIGRGCTHIVISTTVGVHPGKDYPVPYPDLLVKLGSLAANKRIYQEDDPKLSGVPQPQRTDRESHSTTPGVDYLEVVISAV